MNSQGMARHITLHFGSPHMYILCSSHMASWWLLVGFSRIGCQIPKKGEDRDQSIPVQILCWDTGDKESPSSPQALTGTKPLADLTLGWLSQKERYSTGQLTISCRIIEKKQRHFRKVRIRYAV